MWHFFHRHDNLQKYPELWFILSGLIQQDITSKDQPHFASRKCMLRQVFCSQETEDDLQTFSMDSCLKWTGMYHSVRNLSWLYLSLHRTQSHNRTVFKSSWLSLEKYKVRRTEADSWKPWVMVTHGWNSYVLNFLTSISQLEGVCRRTELHSSQTYNPAGSFCLSISLAQKHF